MRLRMTVIALVFLSGWAYGQQVSEEERAAELIREAAQETVVRIPHGSSSLVVEPEDASPMVAQIFSEELMRNGGGVVGRGGVARTSVAIDVRGMNSCTEAYRKSSYLRTVSVSLGVLVRETEKDSVLFSKQYALARRDTIPGEAPYTEMELRAADDDSWLDAIVAPVVAGAAAIVIVVLLFTVRGS